MDIVLVLAIGKQKIDHIKYNEPTGVESNRRGRTALRIFASLGATI
jgi:hypothetical protein